MGVFGSEEGGAWRDGNRKGRAEGDGDEHDLDRWLMTSNMRCIYSTVRNQYGSREFPILIYFVSYIMECHYFDFGVGNLRHLDLCVFVRPACPCPRLEPPVLPERATTHTHRCAWSYGG